LRVRTVSGIDDSARGRILRDVNRANKDDRHDAARAVRTSVRSSEARGLHTACPVARSRCQKPFPEHAHGGSGRTGYAPQQPTATKH
ncbi:MAG: hypothetical protein KDK91_11280, partial [Gammaproteobacteria bacterium]|nr:hypothetical protein [Gammaproteobacteria bacterium]